MHVTVAMVLLDYAAAHDRCTSSSPMFDPYQVRGGYRATFAVAVVEGAMRAGFTGQGPAKLTEFTANGERSVELAEVSPCAEMIDHVLACLAEWNTHNQMEPVSALPALELALEVHQRLGRPAA